MIAWLLACRSDPEPTDPPAPDGPCEPRPYYVDLDGDGVGRTGHALSACVAAAPYVTVDGDCSDHDPEVLPGAVERCNGVDDDCDGWIDEDLSSIRYPDADGDGFGDPLAAAVTCDATWLTIGSDCDDTDASVHPEGDRRFVDITAEAGLGSWVQYDAAVAPMVCANEPLGGGAAVGDVDGDGAPDVFLPRMYLPDVLLGNNGDGTFVDLTAASGISHTGSSNGALFFDVEGDGDLDLFVTSLGLEDNRLYVNDGAGAFTEEALERGVAWPLWSGWCAFNFSASAADVDGDGDLDLHVTAWQEERGDTLDRARLWLNQGDGTFVDATIAAGLDMVLLAGFTSTFVDIDGDRDVDLLLASDWGRSKAYLNDGAGGFTDVTAAAGVGTDENGMGSVIGDPDNDGDPDWFVTGIYDETVPCPGQWGCTGNRLYVNDGSGGFVDGTDAAGVRDGQWGWGAAFFDYDHDGHEDLVQAAGAPTPGFDRHPGRLWHNRGDGSFEDGACRTGLVDVGQGKSAIPFDLDADGDLDVLQSGYGEAPTLWRNDGPLGGAIVVRVVGSTSNPSGVGAAVRLTTDDGTQTRWVNANSTFLGDGPIEAHFGLGGAVSADLSVTWPDGTERTWPDVAAGSVFTATP